MVQRLVRSYEVDSKLSIGFVVSYRILWDRIIALSIVPETRGMLGLATNERDGFLHEVIAELKSTEKPW
jgi:hypothetical protein